jgi:transposase
VTRRKLDDEQLAALRADHAAGVPIKILEHRYGLSHSNIYNYCPARRRHGWADIAALIAAGRSKMSIARELGLRRQKVQYVARRLMEATP